MVKEHKGRIFKRKDGKYLIYVPVSLAEDSMFPFPLDEAGSGVSVKVSFKIGGDKLTVEKWKDEC
ncbi:MAG: hypothetical protein IBV52_07960 [Candidatus Bathyarchaeota archaeon]